VAHSSGEKVRETAKDQQQDHDNHNDVRAAIAVSSNVGAWPGHHGHRLRALTRRDLADRARRVLTKEGHVALCGANGLALCESNEVRSQVLGRLVAPLRRFGEGLHHDRLEVGGNRRVELRRRRHGAVHVLTRHLDGRVADEGWTPGQHFEEDDAQ